MAAPTYNEVIQSKQLTTTDLIEEFAKLKRYTPTLERRCFAGNPILYHYQLDNLCRVRTAAGSFYEMMMNETKREECWRTVNRYANGSRSNDPAGRLFEGFRRFTGAVVFFKPTIAMNVYSQCKPTHVLDVCAGWGGRMLGAMAMGIEYTGIDTNTDLRPAYESMTTMFGGKATMIWGDAMEQDFADIDYDCVLTSPPYCNLEVYPHMTPWENKKTFYTEFLIPLLDKCRTHIKRNGKVCFNISPHMYAELTTVGYEPCKEMMPMLQQKRQGKDKEDMVYVW